MLEEQEILKFRKWIDECIKRLPIDISNYNAININRNNYGIKARLDISGYRIGFMVAKLPSVPTVGVGSLCKGDNARFEHVVFIDYDNILEWIVEEELNWIVNQYKLSNFYLFYTERNIDEKSSSHIDRISGNYHAVSLTKLTFSKINEIIRNTHSDYNYKLMPNYVKYKFWVLRFVGKENKSAPKFLKIIPDYPVNMNNRISKAHKEFFECMYPDLPRLPYTNLDDSEGVFITPYLTSRSQVKNMEVDE